MSKMCYRDLLKTKIPEKYRECLSSFDTHQMQKIIEERIKIDEIPSSDKYYSEDDLRIQFTIMTVLMNLIDTLKSDNIRNAIIALNDFKHVILPFEIFKEFNNIKLIPDLEDNTEILEQLLQLQNDLGIGTLKVIAHYKK